MKLTRSMFVPFDVRVSTTIRPPDARNPKILGALHKQLRDMLDIMLAEHDMSQYMSR